MRNNIIKPFVTNILKRLGYPQSPVVTNMVLTTIHQDAVLKSDYERIIADQRNDQRTVNQEIGRCVKEVMRFKTSKIRQSTTSLNAKSFSILFPEGSDQNNEDLLALYGDGFTQTEARKVLPILVRQSRAGQIIYYSTLAEECGIPNPRTLRTVLGAVAKALKGLSRFWGEEIPPIHFLVVGKNSDLPGNGAAEYSPNLEVYKQATTQRKRCIQDVILTDVYDYQKWLDVLVFFGLEPCLTVQPPGIYLSNENRGKGKESEDHRLLKEFISENPRCVRLKTKKKGQIEYVFPSQDAVDILFEFGNHRVAVEVKSARSNETDLKRGLFQCVKYQALAEALAKLDPSPINVTVILAVGKPFPKSLIPLKNVLGVNVIDNITQPEP